MNLQIAGKTALVTGGSKGIGYAIAAGLVAEGARVVVSARDQGMLEAAVQRLGEDGGDVLAIAADVSSAKGVRGLVDAAVERVGHVDVLIANAGGPPSGLPSNLDDGAWARATELTLMSAVRLARAVLPGMRERGWGRIVNVTSLSVKQPINDLTLSNALRAAVTAFARTLANEVASEGVTVNAVAPGYTATERLEELFADDYARARLLASIPAKRFAAPEEVAAAAVFLCSQQAAYVTGQTLVVDGGMVASTY
ncbi:MAG: SDR family oxidoreductase [Trueperaceae bacterium]|nr:MAG: SDR family oxidoreductase [Trueperaceae bacterium]